MVTAIGEGSQLRAKTVEPAEEALYELRKFLGGGRIALVYLAEQIWPPERKGRQVAIKLARTPEENGWLEAERNLLQKCRARGFPRLEGEGETRESRPRFFLVLEYIQGERLSSLAEKSPEARLPEPDGVDAALQYARVLQTLHREGYASTDRKLDDIYWIEQDPEGPRLVVLDWNVAAKGDARTQAADLYQFGRFWYELLLGSPPPPLQERAFVGLESHPHWHNLTYGTRYILERALHPMEELRYQKADELVEDLEFLVPLFKKEYKDLERIAEAEPERDPRRLMMVLDVIRVRFPEAWSSRWQRRFADAENKLKDQLDRLLEEGRNHLAQGRYDQANQCFKDAQSRGDTRPEQQLRIERWIRLARFAQNLPPEREKIFRQQALPGLIEVVEHLERKNFPEAVEGFWRLLERGFVPAEKIPPSGFTDHYKKAKEAYKKGEDPNPYLWDAAQHLREAWLSPAELFMAVVGLPPYPLETSLRFLADEAMLRKTLWEAITERGRDNLREAANLYGRALFFFKTIPYTALLGPQIGDLQRDKNVCEYLDSTMGEAKKDKEAGDRLLREGKFQAALDAFEQGVRRFPDDSRALPEWARGRGEALKRQLRAGRRRAKLCLSLQEMLDELEKVVDSTADFTEVSPLSGGAAGKPEGRRREARPQPQKPSGEKELLEIALHRCRMLLDQFPDDEWGQRTYKELRERLIRHVERILKSPQPDRFEDTIGDIAHLVSLARDHFRQDLSEELQGWELQATLVLQGEIDRLVAEAQKRLAEGWQAKLEEVLTGWQKGHELLRQMAHFQEVFDARAFRAQERKLDALYDQIKYLAQLQRDIAAEIGLRRAQVDAEELRNRMKRRRAYSLAEEAGRLLAEPEPQRSDLEKAKRMAEEASRLWPGNPDIKECLKSCNSRLEEIDRKFSEGLERGEEALKEKRFDEAEQALQGLPPDILLSESQKETLRALQVALQFERAYARAESLLQERKYGEALQALGEVPADERLAPEQRGSRDALRLGIIGEAHAQARKAMAEGRYGDAAKILGSLADRVMPQDVQDRQARLADFNRRFQTLDASLEQASSLRQEAVQSLEQRPPHFAPVREYLRKLIEEVQKAPEELPEGLRERLKDIAEEIEKGVWEARERMHFWQIGPRAESAECLTLVGLLRRQVETRGVFSPEEVSP